VIYAEVDDIIFNLSRQNNVSSDDESNGFKIGGNNE